MQCTDPGLHMGMTTVIKTEVRQGVKQHDSYGPVHKLKEGSTLSFNYRFSVCIVDITSKLWAWIQELPAWNDGLPVHLVK
jgi:hypothetical protein